MDRLDLLLIGTAIAVTALLAMWVLPWLEIACHL